MINRAIVLIFASGLTCLAQGPIGPVSGGGLRSFSYQNANGFVGTVVSPRSNPSLQLELDVPSNRLMGRASPGTGPFESITIGANLSLSLVGGVPTLSATGGGGGGTGDTISDQSSSVDSQLATFSGITGKHIQASTANGYVVLTGGIVSTVARPGDLVKVSDYGTVGDGMVDDTAAVQTAITAAVGRTVYFPAGTYLCGALTTPSTSPITFLGDGRAASIIKSKPNTLNQLTLAANGSKIKSLGFTGPLKNSVQPFLPSVAIQCIGLSNIIFDDMLIKEFSWVALNMSGCSTVLVTNSDFSTGGMCINAGGLNNYNLINNTFHDLGQSGFSLAGNSITLRGNHYWRAGPVGGSGVIQAGSKNVIIEGETCTDSAGGYEIMTEDALGVTEGFGTGCVFSGNIMSRCWGEGLDTFRGGTEITGNSFLDCGISNGQTNDMTVQPGIIPDLSFPGTGYQAGDILTLSGGTGTAATFVANQVYSGGLCNAAQPATNSVTYPISLGNYTAFPPSNPVSVTGGHGSGAKVIYTNLKINAAGTGYAVGDLLRTPSNVGTWAFPVIVRVLAVTGGAVTSIEVVNGGSFTGTLPTTLSFVAYDAVSVGTGFTATPFWGKRYSMNYGIGGASTSERGSLVALATGYNLVTGNHFSNHATNSGTYTQPAAIVFVDYAPSGPPVLSHHWFVTGNIFGNFAGPAIRHLLSPDNYDCGWGGGMILTPNMGYTTCP